MEYVNKLEAVEQRLDFFRRMKIKPNFSVLSKELDVDRHIISDLYHGRRTIKPRKRKSELDAYVDEIKELLSDPCVSVTAAFFYLSDEERGERQIKCTLSNFFKYVYKHGLDKKDTSNTKAHIRFETEPGQQLQVDRVENMKLTTKEGEVLEFNLFSSTLGYSRMHCFEYSVFKTKDDFKRCLISCLQYFGGKPMEVLTDNMPAVVHVGEDGKRTIHGELAQFFKDLDINLRLCKPGSPQTKGKCESANRFAKRLYSYDGKFADEQELVKIIQRLNDKINSDINNTCLGRPPRVIFEAKEKGQLRDLCLSEINVVDLNLAKSQTVPSTCLIYYKGNYYSVDSNLKGQNVKLIEKDGYLEIYHKNELKMHRKLTKQKINYSHDHYSSISSQFIKDKDDLEEHCKEQLRRFKNLK